MEEQSADNTHDISRFPTNELTDLYCKYKNKAELVWSQLMMRVIFYERTQQENDKLVRLLRECVPYLEQTDETDLQARVIDALSEYQEMP